MRRFMMLRRVDETGVSGLGHVADGVLFEDGTVVVRWRTKSPSTAMFASLDHVRNVHGHNGKTTIEFHDCEGAIAWLCCMCFSDMDIPVNHCFQCGSGGTAVPMSKIYLEQIQVHDRQRIEANDKLRVELAALRRIAIDTYGPTALGLSVSRWEDHEGKERISGIRRGDTTFGVRPGDGESDEAFLRREGERCELDPVHVRSLHAERGRVESRGCDRVPRPV